MIFKVQRQNGAINGGKTTCLIYSRQCSRIQVKIKNAFDRELIYEYGANGKVTQITDFDGTTQKMWYDSCNRPIRYENQEGNIAEFTRDKLGNLICEKMPNGAETHFVYDRNNKMIAYIDPMGGKTKFAYDACGNCIRIEDAEGHIKKYT